MSPCLLFILRVIGGLDKEAKENLCRDDAYEHRYWIDDGVCYRAGARLIDTHCIL